MKIKTILMCISGVSVLALVAGCGKTETAVPPMQKAGKPLDAAIPAPTQTSVTTAPQTSTPATIMPAVKPVDTAVTPAKDAAASAVGVSNLTTNHAQVSVDQAKTTLASLSQDQIVQGLKDALAKGLQQAIAKLGQEGGFLTNLDVKIPMPEKLQKVENALRTMKQDKLADDFVATMNHAAEQAVPEASSVFADALKQMTIDDAKSILSGPNDAATQYFQKTTQTNLYARFYPIVQKATEKSGVTAAYKKLMEKANVSQGLGSLGSALGGSLLGKESLDVDAYVTTKAMDGLFRMVAAEEQKIRQNPVARSTDLLQKVFGALKK